MDCILLRGLMHESGHWHDFPRDLARALPEGYRLQCMNHPGVGDQRHREPPSSVEAMADDLEQRAPAGRKLIIAMSLGSMVAAAWAQRHPDQVAGLVLLVPSMRGLPVWARLRPRALGLMLIAALRSRARDVAATVQRMTSNRSSDAAHRRIAAQRIVLARLRPPHPQTLFRQLLAAARFTLPQAPSCPVLLLGSRSDRMVRSSCTRAWAQHWGCSYRLHAHSGHDLSVDASDWLIKEITAWLQRQQKALQGQPKAR